MNLLERFRKAKQLAGTKSEKIALKKEFSREEKRVSGLKAKERLGTDYKRSIMELERRQKERQAAQFFKLAQAKQQYAKSTSGKIGKGIETGLRLFSQGGVDKFVYRKSLQKNPYSRGRPKGTLDKRYAAYGGVYGFRKFMSQQRALQRFQAQRAATISPEQASFLNQVEAQKRAQQQNPEQRAIPDTTGKINLDKYMKEIMDAAGAVD